MSWASTALDQVNATLGRASQLNDYFFVYGILDNVAQLAKIFPIERLEPGFPMRLLGLLEKSSNKKLHAKSVSLHFVIYYSRSRNMKLTLYNKIQILLANPGNRLVNEDGVRKQIHKSLWTKYI